jgi:tRNA-Thr(GGU) m(6)t(6)A37 methyltransferase TsaA
MDNITIRPIAYIKTDFPEKFGIPRQSGLIPELKARIVFEKEYRDPNAIREIDKYSHLWLIWGFSENKKTDGWEPTVRPPRLGGNTRVGVFASRSPYRPNPLGLTVVKIEGVEQTRDEGKVLIVSGADMLDGTPIYDIKPYLAYVDSIPEASNGFAAASKEGFLEVAFTAGIDARLTADEKAVLEKVLAQDPRPQYQEDPDRVYKMSFKTYNIEFTVERGKLTVTDIK